MENSLVVKQVPPFRCWKKVQRLALHTISKVRNEVLQFNDLDFVPVQIF